MQLRPGGCSSKIIARSRDPFDVEAAGKSLPAGFIAKASDIGR